MPSLPFINQVNTVATDISTRFPFSAVVGQGEFKHALLLAAVNPAIGGVLISGPRGAAKSTLARGLADILSSAPFVTLPLGTSEEMLCGTLNLQAVLDQQTVDFKPGLLAKAHGGVLYVDEVNLLADNLVDLLLDVSASGTHMIERDGISHQHAAQFILLGTMNPDEGELRSQLLDRFGLSLNLSSHYDIEQRVEIVKLREQFDKDPSAFYQHYQQQQQALAQTITQAQALVPQVNCADALRVLIAQRCCEANVDGLRADIVWLHAAIANAALSQRTEVSEEDVLAVEHLVLNHRRQSSQSPSQPPAQSPPPFSRPEHSHPSPPEHASGEWGAMAPQSQKTQPLANPVLDKTKKNLKPKAHVAQPLNEISKYKAAGNAKGRRITHNDSPKVNWFKTLLSNAGQWPLRALNFYQQSQGVVHIHLVLLDTSGSILANKAFAKAKGLILQISQQAYLQREQLVIIGFGNQHADILWQSQRAPKTLIEQLDAITASGGTPFIDALASAQQFQQQQLRKNTKVQFTNYLITDGRIKQLQGLLPLQGDSIVVDVEQSHVKRGNAQAIASALNAHYIPLMV